MGESHRRDLYGGGAGRPDIVTREAKIVAPHPTLIEIAIEPKSKTDQEKLGLALAQLAAEDPSFLVSTDQETGQTILKGMSELHLDRTVDSLKRICDAEFYLGAPQVAYRETITRRATKDYTHKKLTGGSGQFAAVKIVVEPLPSGTSFQFEKKIVGGALPEKYIPGVKKGLESALVSGILAGFPVVDVKVTLVDGKHHEVDSSVPAFEIAARMALREALRDASPVLIEPVMKVEVVTPWDRAKQVIADLNSWRVRIQGQDSRGDAIVIDALVPLASMFGYVSNLCSMSEGQATFAMRFDHYAEVPRAPDDDPTFRPAIGMRP